MQKIPIFTDDPGWHGAELKSAFAKRGVEAVFVSLQDCALDLSRDLSRNLSENLSQQQIKIPFFEAPYPQGAFVRCVSGGTLQQVITRLNILHILAMQNVTVYNSGKAIERTVDKAMTSFLLRQHSVATPATWVCESRKEANVIRETHNKTVVLKPLFGSQGQGVRQLQPSEPLPVPMQMHVDGVYYLQEFIQTPIEPHDYRVFVIAGKVVAAMKRTANLDTQWVSNVAAGGHCEAVTPNEIMQNLAINAAKAVQIDYCGVDIIQSITGEHYVLEVNSIPAWKGLQSVTKTNIAELLVDDFLSKLT